MNKLHVNGLPPNITDSQLREIFEQIGPVHAVKIFRNTNGSCVGLGRVEMQLTEDLEEILASRDHLTIAGKRLDVWKVGNDSTVAMLVGSEYHGVYVGECKGRWIVFELSEGRLLWIRNFDEEPAANDFRKWLAMKRRNQAPRTIRT